MVLVGVFGTLRRGGVLHEVYRRELGYDLRRVQTIRLKGFMMYDTGGGYPYIEREGSNSVVVEIFEVEPVVLAHMDRTESHPQLYERKLHKIGNMMVWIYSVFHGFESWDGSMYKSKERIIPEGDWLKYDEKR